MSEKTFYVDPAELARKYGLEVKPLEGETRDLEWITYTDIDDDLCGYIERDNDGSIVIYYNPLHHEHRQRFTIAHELAHYLLGHLDIKDKLERDTSKHFTVENYDPIEAQANKLAAEILMPKDKIEFLIEKGISDINKLAKMLKVSPAAMSYRLEKLGYL